MRYISPYYRLTLYGTKGQPVYIFKNGELIVGDAKTTNGTDVTTQADAYTIHHDHTFKGETSNLFAVTTDFGFSGDYDEVEQAGMGYLDGGALLGETIDPIEDGWMNRKFFMAPLIEEDDTPVTGAWYKVHNGTVTYNGKTYKAGSIFKAVSGGGDIEIPSGTTAIYSLELPVELRSVCAIDLNAEFKTKHLEHGDEPLEYFLWDQASGYLPRNDLGTLEAGFIGGIR